MNDKSLTDDPETEQNFNELKRCISRLSFVGMGLSKELDLALDSLRKIIKSGASNNISDIKEAVDEISKVLTTMEDKADLKSTQLKSVGKQVNLLEQLIAQNLPQAIKIGLQKKYNPKSPPNDQQIVIAIAETIDEYLQNIEVRQPPLSSEAHLHSDPSSSLATPPAVVQPTDLQSTALQSSAKGGFFSRLLARFKSAPELCDSEKTAYSAPTRQDDLPDDLRTSLRTLVDQLSAQRRNTKLADTLTTQLDKLQSVGELSQLLETLTNTYVEVAGVEHRQFEKFLLALNKRLDRVNDFINSAASYSLQVKDESGALDQALKTGVSSIKTSVESATSLGEVKQHIYLKMDSLVERVDLFYKQQQKSHHNLNKNLDRLREQLKATEDESARLKDDLAAQKMRAQTDPLTLLPNRYSYNEHLTQEYNRWRRYRSSLTLVVGDIDYFKSVNDNYGHAGGDEVLKQVARFLQAELRESDYIARFGGEEFVIILPETTLVHATKAINKLRLGIKECPIKFEGQQIQIAMSFGISEFEDDDTPKVVFERADKALYRAKEKGRDQVCCQRAQAKD